MYNNLSNKSKSLSSLHEASSVDYRRHSPNASQAYEDIVNSGSQRDSGLGEDLFGGLESKIDQLNDLYLEQCRLLSDIKDEMQSSKEGQGPGLVMELLLKAVHLNCSQGPDPPEDTEQCNVRARSLLAALRGGGGGLDGEIAQALLDFLQSEELTTHITHAAVEAVRASVQDTLSAHLSRLYVPTLERCQRRLVRHVTAVLEDAFMRLEAHTSSHSSSLQRSALWLRRAMDRHHNLLRTQRPIIRTTLQRVLEKELHEWRERILAPLHYESRDHGVPRDFGDPGTPEPASPQQPADPNTSVIDQLMMTAEINKLLRDGDVNGAFEKALSAADLSLVMCACRGIPASAVFGPPCRVSASVLLSLLQQLATDMVHDTQIKCGYLEEALICLNNSAESTRPRAHLPLVLGDVRKHLSDFLAKYPSHVASRRIMLIIMAADNLLK